MTNLFGSNGYADAAYKIASQETYPSWGWWIVNDATNLYENWNIDAPRDISPNHIMFGEIGAWIYKALGGIRVDPQSPEFKNVLINPHFVEGLNKFSASHESPSGTIVSSWEKSKKVINYQLTIPPNSTAAVSFDTAENQKIYLDGKSQKSNEINLEAGVYNFKIK